MRCLALALAALLPLAAATGPAPATPPAATPPAAAATCQRRSFMDQCLSQSQRVLEACGNTDTCLCTQYKLQAACYDNCPADPTSVALKNQTLTVANQRCAGTGNAPRPPPITTVNVDLKNNSVVVDPNSDFGKDKMQNTTNSTASMHGAGGVVVVSLAAVAGWSLHY